MAWIKFSGKFELRHVILLVFVPILANIGLLTGISHCDPETIFSGLGVGVNSNGIPGAACFVDPAVAYITQPLGFLSAEDWLHGIVPWWNPYSGVGMPLAAEMQNESFFLPFVLLLHFHSGWLLQRLVFQILSGFFTYAFLLELPLAPTAALFGGLLYSLNGAFILTPGAVTGTIFCLPLLMLGVEKARSATVNSTGPGWSLVTLALALSIYAGFPEMAFFNGLLASAWILLRLLQMPGNFRRRFLGKIIIGGLTGMALTAPLTIPFAEYLSVGSIAAHARLFAVAVLPAAAAPIQLLPLFYGALAIPQASQWQVMTFGDMWVRFGGWFGCSPLLLAIYALMPPVRRQRVERYFFALFVLVWELRYFGAPGARALFNLIPGMANADAIRFSTVSVMFAMFSLAASGFNDAACVGDIEPRRLYKSLILFGASFCLAVSPALSILQLWFHAYPALKYYAAFYFCATMATFALLVYAVRIRRRLRLAGGMIIAGSVAVFLLPQFHGTLTGSLNERGIAKLQSFIGFSRFYTTGPFGPNFPAMHQIASINYSQLPAPKVWSDYIDTYLFPDANLVDFTGHEQGQDWALIVNFANYAPVGVKYIVSPPSEDPFQWQASPFTVTAAPGFSSLIAGSEISGKIRFPNLPAARITSVSMAIGTYFGQSTGVLQAELCAHGKCAFGEGEVSNIPDHSRLIISLDRTLNLSAGDFLTFTLIHPYGRWVAIWLNSDPLEPGGVATSVTALPNGASELAFSDSLSFANNTGEGGHITYVSSMIDPGKSPLVKQVFHDDSMTIYELPNPAPYAELSDKSCSLIVLTRQKMISQCAHPTALIRRELYFSGWWATVNGSSRKITKVKGIFQEVAVPAGRSEIQFFYSPPYTGEACAVAMIAFLFWVATILAGSKGGWSSNVRGLDGSEH